VSSETPGVSNGRKYPERPYVGVGMILARRRRMAEAITAFRGALSADPGYGPAHLELAGALDAVGQPAEAWPAAARAHDLGEDVPADLWQRLAEKVPSVPPLPAPCAGATGSAIDLDRPPPDVREYVTRIRDRIRSHRAYPRLALDRRQGGELQIESLPEQGTTVRFTLPAEPPPAS